MTFGAIGNFKSNVLVPNGYLMPGTLATHDVPSDIIRIPFYEPVIMKSATFSSTLPFLGGDHTHINVWKYNSSYTASTMMYGAEINSVSTLIYVDGISSFTFYTGDNLVVQMSTSVTATNTNGILAKLELF
jgi:hypothetical protein